MSSDYVFEQLRVRPHMRASADRASFEAGDGVVSVGTVITTDSTVTAMTGAGVAPILADLNHCETGSSIECKADVSITVEQEGALDPNLDLRPEDDQPAHSEYAAELRAEAVRYAAIACARALRKALDDDGATITRFVDDALQACGRVLRARVRLHPENAVAYRPQRDVDLVADDSLEPGAVVVEANGGQVEATLEQRAELLCLAAAAHA